MNELRSRKNNNILEVANEIAIYAKERGCTDYGIYLNRGEDYVTYKIGENTVESMANIFLERLTTPKERGSTRTLGVREKDITNIYYHELVGCMIVGVLTSKKNKGKEFTVENYG